MNRQLFLRISSVIIIAFMLFITLWGIMISDEALMTDFTRKNLSPSSTYFFGTDWLGRDIFQRTIKGLSSSIIIAIMASVSSSIIALIMGILSATAPKWVDNICAFLIDLVMSIPHLILLVLISFCFGRGTLGVLMGLMFTHWTSLARVIRGEVLAIKSEQYIKMSQKFGKSNFYIARKHIIPHIVPQFIVGVVVMFPHVILHEASITFLGFGLSPEEPAIGIILSESMNYITSNMWWLFLPGVCLVILILLFDKLGDNLKNIY